MSAYRRAALGRVHRVEQARLLREAAALLLAGPAALAAGGLVTRLLQLDRRPGGDRRLRAPAGLRPRASRPRGARARGEGAGLALDRARWRRRALEALALAGADRFPVNEALRRAVGWLDHAPRDGRGGFGLANELLAVAAGLDADPEVDALLAVLDLLDGAPERGEARARAALALPALGLASDPERLRGSLELVRALAREERGRGVASLPALERARAAADPLERAQLDALALSIALGAGELHVARVAAARLAARRSAGTGMAATGLAARDLAALAEVVARRGARRGGAAPVTAATRAFAGRLLASRNRPAATVVLESLRAAGHVVVTRGGEERA